MEDISLSENESRYYGDLFLCYDEENTGKIPMIKASELYHSANISTEKILEISSLAGIPDTALHVSRVQFYSCLKLIAAHQASMPLKQELITASVQLDLPRFSWSSNNMEMANKYQKQLAIPSPTIGESDSVLSRRNSTAVHPSKITTINSDLHSTVFEMEQGGGQKCVSVISGHNKNHRRGVSPEAWSTNSDSPTPTNSVAEHSWKKKTLWHGLLGDEHRQLLGTEEESSDRHSTDEENESDLETVYQITSEQREYYFKQFKAVHHDPNDLLCGQVARVFFEKSRIPIEELRHIWQLCDVSRDGALSLAEFTAAMHLVVLRRNNIPLPAVLPACLHPNVLQHSTNTTIQIISQTDPPEADLLHLNDDDDEDNTDNSIIGVRATVNTATGSCVGINVIRNSAVRTLNEKDDMSINTLSMPSKVSVGTRHGTDALISNPKTLTPPIISQPPTLNLQNSPTLTPSAAPPIPPLQLLTVSNRPKLAEVSASTFSSPQMIWTKEVQSNQWTQFNVSPTSNISSPGPKPVNFDMQRTAQAVVSDPQILHPVPLRLTPIAPTVTDTQSAESHDVSVGVSESSPKSFSMSFHRDSLQNNDLRAIQRPQAKKFTTKNKGGIPPPPQRESATGGNITICDHEILGDVVSGYVANNLSMSMIISKKDHPPLPPPRPHRHGRSSSLDLKKFKIGTPSTTQTELMAQTSFDLQTSTGFADFTHFHDVTKLTAANAEQSQQMCSLQSQNLAGRNIQTISEAQPPLRLSLQSNQRISAFEVYRKPNTSQSSQSPTILPANDTISGVSSMGPVAITTPFGSVAATAMTVKTSLPNSELYEKNFNAISETLRQVSFKQEHDNNNMIEVLRHLHEQNNLLLHLCNDLSDELLTAQTRKEEMRLKLEATTNIGNLSANAGTDAVGHSEGAVRTGSSISAPVTANITGGSSSSVHSNI